MKLKKIIEKTFRKNLRKNKESKQENIAWPCSWNYEAVESFNAMLYGMALEKTMK